MPLNRNRLANVHNMYQQFFKYKRVLCVCSAGLLRSPTIARVLQEEYGYNTRAAGVTTEYALVPVDAYLLEWADEVICAGKEHKVAIEHMFPECKKPIKVLDIPDNYAYMDPTLCALIRANYKEVSK